jgi:hypothetical protein
MKKFKRKQSREEHEPAPPSFSRSTELEHDTKTKMAVKSSPRPSSSRVVLAHDGGCIHLNDISKMGGIAILDTTYLHEPSLFCYTPQSNASETSGEHVKANNHVLETLGLGNSSLCTSIEHSDGSKGARSTTRDNSVVICDTRQQCRQHCVVVGTRRSPLVSGSSIEVTSVTNPVTLLFFYTTMSTFLRQAANVVRAPSHTSSTQNILITRSAGPPGIVKARFRVLDRVTQGYVPSSLTNPVPPLIPNTPADLVQDLYLREVKAYKPIPTVSNLRLPKPHRETKEL